jgi:hypothetical protein
VCGRGRAAPPLLPPRALSPTQEEAEEEAQLWHQEVLALGKFVLLKGMSHEIKDLVWHVNKSGRQKEPLMALDFDMYLPVHS